VVLGRGTEDLENLSVRRLIWMAPSLSGVAFRWCFQYVNSTISLLEVWSLSLPGASEEDLPKNSQLELRAKPCCGRDEVYEFGLVYSVTLTTNSLETALQVRNEGQQNFEFKVLMHNFTVRSVWSLSLPGASEEDLPKNSQLELRAKPCCWPYEFGLVYSVTLTTNSLETALQVRNEGQQNFEFKVVCLGFETLNTDVGDILFVIFQLAGNRGK
jgi:hypothetical protein